jgi:hypothetical protein
LPVGNEYPGLGLASEKSHFLQDGCPSSSLKKRHSYLSKISWPSCLLGH